MAASDPTTDVPTPTGTLQGVAAFSWDGSAWQPSGRAGPSVATPTGVVRGVAAFNGGPTWQPSGLAQPSVPTPTGTLDGVAVYTWSGAAWTPPGGQPTPSTPSGALRGVAAFNWDGAAWQPAGQAGPSVATPYGVLDGVAMFNWTGSAWAAVGAPSLSLDFMRPGTLDPRITFTRASTATYFDRNGVMQTAAANAPRWDYNPSTLALNGLLIEEARTNLLFYSQNFPTGGWSMVAATVTTGLPGAPDASATMMRLAETTANSAHYAGQALAVLTSSGTYTLSVYAQAQQDRYMQLSFLDGSSNGGQATFDLQAGVISGPLSVVNSGTIGTASIRAVGGGIYRCAITVTIGAVTTGTAYVFLSNVAASGWAPSYAGNAANGLLIWGADLEAGAFPTSYIPTAGAAVTRVIDACGIPPASMAPWFASPGGSWMAEFSFLNATTPNIRIIAYPPGAGGPTPVFLAPGMLVGQYDNAAAVNVINAAVTGAITKAASTWAVGSAAVCLNAGAVAASAALTAGYGAYVTYGISFLTNGTAENTSGYLRRVRYWPRVLSNAELQAVTT